MRCDNWSLMYFNSLSHDTISPAEAELTRSLFNASSLWGYRNDTMHPALWSGVELSLISAPQMIYKRGKKGERKKDRGQTKDREGQTHSQHIFSSLWVRGGGGGRSFNYWLPSQANIPACQGPFWLSFGQSSSDGPHFLLNRTRRCCENGDTWSGVQETGNASAKPRACQDTLHTFPSMNPMRMERHWGGV